jgi:hypothetical protein
MRKILITCDTHTLRVTVSDDGFVYTSSIMMMNQIVSYKLLSVNNCEEEMAGVNNKK